MEDKTLTCICGKEFVFTIGEQEFYKDKGFNPPRRCPACRQEKKTKQQQDSN